MKKELRQKTRRMLESMPQAEMAEKSSLAMDLLTGTSEYARSEIVMVYLSLPTEIDTTGVVLRAWQDHKRVLAPRISWEQRRMMPTEIRSLTSDLVETSMGLREPVSGPPIPISLIDMVIVPGLAFDEVGNRLGRGRGFYDRFLAHPEFDGVTCGFSFEDQVLKEVPAEPLDRPVSMLVTNKRVRRFSSKSKVAR